MPRLLVFPRLRPPADPGSDRDLVRRYADAADPEAFAELVRRHGPAVLGVCRRAARNAHLADDAFQATFLVLARKAASLRDPAAVGGWLFGVARRTATAARRRELRRAGGVSPRVADHQGAHAPRSPDPSWDDLLAVLDAELARLPDKLRAPLLCCYHDGRTQDEAARHLGLSLSTVRRRLDRGRELLRVRMTARGATLGAGLFGGVLAPAVAVPEPLCRAAVDHAAGGPVPGRVLALAAAGPAVGKWLAAAVVFVAGGLAVGLGVGRPTVEPPKSEPAKPVVLKDGPPEPLPKGAVARMGSSGFRHPDAKYPRAFSPDGKYLVTAGRPVACVWDAGTGRLIRSFGTPAEEPGADMVEGVGLLADGKTLVLTGYRRATRDSYRIRHFVWDVERDAEVRAMEPIFRRSGGFGPVKVFSPDGSLMAESAGLGGTVHLLGRDGMPAGDLENAVEHLFTTALTFSPDGKLLYVAREDQGVVVWDTKTLKPVRTLGEGRRPVAVAASADGKLVAAFDAAPQPKEGTRVRKPEAVRVWDPATGKSVAEFPWQAAPVDGQPRYFEYGHWVGFLSDGSLWAAVAGERLTFRRWEREGGRAVADWTVPGDTFETAGMAVSPDGSRVVVGGRGTVLRLLDGQTGKDVTPAVGHRGELLDLVFSPDGTRLVTAAADGTVRTWDATTGRERRAVEVPGPSLRLSPDGQSVYAAVGPESRIADGGPAVVRDTATGRERYRLPGARVVVPQPDGKTVWWSGAKGPEAAPVDAATGKPAGVPPGHGLPLAFGDGGRLAIALSGSTLTGWDPTTGGKRFAWDVKEAELLRAGPVRGRPELHYADGLVGAAASPDGKHLAFVVHRNLVVEDDGSTLYLCEAATGKVVWRVKASSQFARSVAFSPDGKSLAVGGWQAKLFDAATGDERAVFDGHRGYTNLVAFSPDGSRLATGGSDGTAVVWELPRK